MNADQHALIDLDTSVDDHRAAIFKVEQCVSNSFTLIVGDQNAVVAASDFALVWLIVVEQTVHDRRAARIGQKFRLIADQTTGRCVEHHTNAVAAGRTQLDHFGLAFGHLLHNRAGIFFIDVDDDFFHRLQLLAVLAVLHDDARTRNAKLEALTAHVFDQNCKLQFATTGNEERILFGRFLDLQCNVAFSFLEQTVTDNAARHLVAFRARIRAVIDDEGHGHGRRIDWLRSQRLAYRRIAEGVGNSALGKTGDSDDVACMGFVNGLTLDAAESEDLRDTAIFEQRTILTENLDGLVRLDRAGMDTTGDDAAQERIGFEDRTDHAERTFSNLRCRNVLQHEVEQRSQTFVLWAFRVQRHPAVTA